MTLLTADLRTVFMDSLYTTGYFFITISMSKSGGSFVKTSAANSSITSSGDFPAPPDCLGRVSKIPSKSWLVSWLSFVMSAFSWRPKTYKKKQNLVTKMRFSNQPQIMWARNELLQMSSYSRGIGDIDTPPLPAQDTIGSLPLPYFCARSFIAQVRCFGSLAKPPRRPTNRPSPANPPGSKNASGGCM